MTRDHLDAIREKSRLFKAALDRAEMLRAALDNAETRELARGEELAEELFKAGVVEGDAFEHSGLVSWYRERPDGRLALDHVRLAFHRESKR